MKHAIIGDDIHILVKISDDEDWTKYAWRIHEKGKWYWVPVQDCKREEKEEVAKKAFHNKWRHIDRKDVLGEFHRRRLFNA